ncbi:hypothetical protein [Anaerosacchariphilus polymeriproducens]|uniref:DNA-binding protein n=1 Tax=Anaerosacchariphilus polymeriproducens TaxID=1812858 RepID=A0A371AZR3_9FIRM|nr:hypothetical protein [Anaerosacchariphilus polymeriproducens]RDU25039.1 hypothetical protein DWV06_01225 [Anaerosacchariphilus polymeriproducens]
MNILDYIPEGRENAVTREYLVNATGMSDREVRREIQEARERTVIINLSNGNGYFIPNAKDDSLLLAYVLQERKREKSIRTSLNVAEMLLEKITGGLKWHE